MKKISSIIAAGALAALLAPLSIAQNSVLSTGYFTDGYPYRHKLNPAFTPTMSTISFLVGNISASTSGSLTAGSLFYPTKDGLSTFMSPNVTADMLLPNLKDKNTIGTGLDLTLLSVGWFNSSGKIFNTIDIDQKASLYGNLPKGLFEFLKGSSSNNEYDFSGLQLKASSYTQVSFGQSYGFMDGRLRVGYKAKVLFGEASMDMNFSKCKASLGKEKWQISAEGYLNTEGIPFGTKEVDGKKVLDFTSNKIDAESMVGNVFSNFGLAFDLGASFDILDWLQASASIQDLGFIGWNHAYKAGLANASIVYPDPTVSDDKQLDKFGEQMGNLFSPEGSYDGTDKISETLPAILRIGAQVRLPMYQKLSAGLLYTQQINPVIKWGEFRGSLNYDALRWLSLSVSCAGGTYGAQVGALVNIHTRGFGFFAGMDNIPFKYSVQGMPVNTSTLKANIGIYIQFGKYFGRYPKEDKKKK